MCFDMATGHLCLHFGAHEHPYTTYFDVHQGYRVLTHSHLLNIKQKHVDFSMWLRIASLSLQITCSRTLVGSV